MASLPSPEASRAVFIGASAFDALDDLPAVPGNVSKLADLFASEVWRLPARHCRRVLNPPSTREASRAVREAAGEAVDTLLVYYSGHGLLDTKGRLHLAMPDSDPQSVYDTALPYEWIRMAVESSPAMRRIVILDCCYSARAMGPQSTSMAALAEADGTYVLAAAAETAVALAPPGETYTAFTGALVQLLTDGIAGAQEILTLDALFTGLQSILRRQKRPDPQSLCRNQVGQTPFARNPAQTVEEPKSSRLQAVVAQLYRARSLNGTLQAVADGVVKGLDFELAAVNLVKPDGDLVVAAVAGSAAIRKAIAGRTGSRASWERRLTMGERWGDLRFIPYTEAWVLMEDDVPQWQVYTRTPQRADEWHPMDLLMAPMHSPDGDLLGVISVDKPRNGLRPDTENRQALQAYAAQAGSAIGNARLRANMQRALVRMEREQQALRASEESFRQAFEYAPSGMAVTELGGDQHGRLVRTNDALCRLLGRPAAALRRCSFSDLVHPEDLTTLLRTSAEGGRAELRLARRDGSYVWVSLRNSVVADSVEGPRFLLTHVEDIEERKRHELQLAHRASHDSLTGLPNSAELNAALAQWLCDKPDSPSSDEVGSRRANGYWSGLDGFVSSSQEHIHDPWHVHVASPTGGDPDSRGLAVFACGLDGFKSINDRFGYRAGDAVLQEVAQRLTTASRANDIVGRLRSDEYLVIAPDLSMPDAEDFASRLRNAITPPIRVESRAVRVGITFGVAWAVCGQTAEQVIQTSTEALQAAKLSHRASRR
jgi:diguanylate cyclase (GGDEF)-like protein/PAS domain S-box-containing protein